MARLRGKNQVLKNVAANLRKAAEEKKAAAAASPSDPQKQAEAQAAEQSAQGAESQAAASESAEPQAAAEAPAQSDEGGGAEEAPAEEAPAEEAPAEEAPAEEAPAEEAPAEDTGALDSTVSGELARGFWVKTRFWQEGPFLKSSTICVSCGDAEVLSFQVDLRPIAKAIARHQVKAQTRAINALTKPMGRKPSADPTIGCGVFDPGDCLKKVTRAIEKGADDLTGDAEKIFKKAKGAAKKIGRSKLLADISKGVRSFAKKVGSYAGTFSGFDLVRGILKGERIDHALMNEFKAALKATKELAPYAQIIVATIPGVGTGIAAGLAGAVALAEGKPITDALVAAGRAAVPGGAAAKAAFDVGSGLAKGQRIDKVALEAARNQLPESARRGFDAGVALAQGKVLQAGMAASGADRELAKFTPTPRGDDRTLSIHAAASHILDRLQSGATAESAKKNVARSKELVARVNEATKKIGPKKTEETLRSHPLLAQKVRRAMLVSTAASKITPASFEAPLAAARAATKELAKIVAAARSSDPKTREGGEKALAALRVVAEERAQIAAAVAAHGGGIPGMVIDRRGRIVRGQFLPKATKDAAKDVFYSRHGIMTGNFTRLSAPPAAPTTRPALRSAPARRVAGAPSHHEGPAQMTTALTPFQKARQITSQLRLRAPASPGRTNVSLAVAFKAQGGPARVSGMTTNAPAALIAAARAALQAKNPVAECARRVAIRGDTPLMVAVVHGGKHYRAWLEKGAKERPVRVQPLGGGTVPETVRMEVERAAQKALNENNPRALCARRIWRKGAEPVRVRFEFEGKTRMAWLEPNKDGGNTVRVSGSLVNWARQEEREHPGVFGVNASVLVGCPPRVGQATSTPIPSVIVGCPPIPRV
jgi:hypothetical protein